MEAKVWSKALVPQIVNRWRGLSLFYYLVPEVVNRWRWHALFGNPFCISFNGNS